MAAGNGYEPENKRRQASMGRWKAKCLLALGSKAIRSRGSHEEPRGTRSPGSTVCSEVQISA